MATATQSGLWTPEGEGWKQIIGGWFHEESHCYRDTAGVHVTSVTQVLDIGGFYAGLERIGEKRLEFARLRGDATHHATALVDANKLDWGSVAEAVKPRLDAYLEFLADTNFKPRLIEHGRIAIVNGVAFAMTVDREGPLVRNGVTWPAVVELKATATLEPHYGIQLALYDRGLGWPTDPGVPRRANRLRYAVQLMDTGKYKVAEYEDESDYDCGLSALVMASWKLRKGGYVRG